MWSLMTGFSLFTQETTLWIFPIPLQGSLPGKIAFYLTIRQT